MRGWSRARDGDAGMYGHETTMTAGAMPSDLPESRARVSPVWIVLYVLLAFASGVAASYGLEHDDTFWLVIAAGVFAPLIVVGAHAAARLESSPRAAATGVVCGLTIVAIVGLLVASAWWGDDAGGDGAGFALAATDPSAHVYWRNEPGGKELVDQNPMVSRRTYQFECGVELGDSTRWLRLDGSHRWAPATVLLPTGETKATQLPRC